MRIRQISVTNLFGKFNHSVQLNLTDRITIIHGPNGLGKTALLKLINALFTRDYFVLSSIPFGALYVDFENGCQLSVSQNYQNEMFADDRPIPSLTFTWITSDEIPPERQIVEPDDLSTTRDYRFSFPPDFIEHEIPELERIASRLWHNRITDETLTISEIFERFGDKLPIPNEFSRARRRVSEWLRKVTQDFSVRFIEAERLIKLRSEQNIRRSQKGSNVSRAVQAYSTELASEITSKLAESAALSQSLDSTFPRRLIQFRQEDALSETSLREHLERIEAQRSRLINVGLLDKEEEGVFPISLELDEHKRVLSVYVDDTETKLGVFQELAQKIELMQDIINRRFSYKSIAVNKETGFVFQTDDGHKLSPTDLSSGEQQQIVLTYELLFKGSDQNLILIDEPEISLHVAWQMQYLKDLQSIIGLVPFDILIATHSPQIINDRWDLTVKLTGPVHG